MITSACQDGQEQSRAAAPSAFGAPRAVVCGTFHRELEVLAQDVEALKRASCDVLSPVDVEFVAEVDGFVLAAHERRDHPEVIEERHLRALRQADFVWLHAPGGYIGCSAALEVGVAHAHGIPVFARETPTDHVLSKFVDVVDDVHVCVARVSALGTHTPAEPLEVLQDYYARIAAQRGYSSETPQDAMLLLTEEVGELARAVRREVGIGRSDPFIDDGVAAELADIQLYLLHLANVCGVRLAAAVNKKEQHNASRARAIAA